MEDWVLRGNKLLSMLRIKISLQAKMELVSGAEAYLVHLELKEKEFKELQSITIFSELPKVFGELLGLSPLREVKFSIELESVSIPICKAPYRMTPTKLKELKSQLQEPLTKGFIRPNISP